MWYEPGAPAGQSLCNSPGRPPDAHTSVAPDPRARVTAALGALLAGPAAGTPGALFPTPVAVRKVLLGADGTLYVDLQPEAGGEPPPAGSTEEMQRVYALVHTALDAAPVATV